MVTVSRLILLFFSYATTFLATQHLLRPGDDPTVLAITGALALAVEAVLYGLKEAWFGRSKAAGAVGFTIDGLVNTGGALTFAGRILTFGPIALTLGFIGLPVTDPTISLIGTVVLSVALGFALSILPHLMKKRRRAANRE